MDKPNKISYNDALKNTTMFFSSDEIETSFENLVNNRTLAMKSKLSVIASKDGLKDFIKNDSDAIPLLITLLNISEEKFKRVVSWVRMSMGYTFDSEWTPKSLRGKLLCDSKLLDDFCDLISNGYLLEKFTSIIPKFVLDDFKIDDSVINRLSNDDYIKNLIKKKIQTEYNNQCCNYYHSVLYGKIRDIATGYGLEFIESFTPQSSPHVSIGKIEFEDRAIYIADNYYLTTSSSQTEYAEKNISPLYQGLRGNSNIILINILDGAGWIGRSSDFRKIYEDCHYYLNLKTINNITEIIKYHFNI